MVNEDMFFASTSIFMYTAFIYIGTKKTYLFLLAHLSLSKRRIYANRIAFFICAGCYIFNCLCVAENLLVICFGTLLMLFFIFIFSIGDIFNFIRLRIKKEK